MWRDMELYDWFTTFIMTAVVGILLIDEALELKCIIETNLLLKTVISLRN